MKRDKNQREEREAERERGRKGGERMLLMIVSPSGAVGGPSKKKDTR